MIKSQLIYAHLVINQGSHNHISQKTFVHPKKSHKVERAIQMQSMWLKMTSARIFYFCKKKMDLPDIREYIVQKSSLNVFGVIKVFHKNTFVWHRKTHDEKKSYKCDQCDKSFIKKNRLLIHQRTNSEEKTFKYHHYFFLNVITVMKVSSWRVILLFTIKRTEERTL